MAGGGSQQKTEQPTPRRLQEARKRGQVIKSRDLSAAIMLLLTVAFAAFTFTVQLPVWQRHLAWYIEQCMAISWTEYGLGAAFPLFLTGVGSFLLILLGIFFLSAVLVNVGQTGFLFAPQAVVPRWERINPVEGFKRIFSLRTVVELVKTILKAAVVGVVTYLVARKSLNQLLWLFWEPPVQAFITAVHILLTVAAAAGVAFLLLAIGDYFYQRYEYFKSLRMTKQEVKDELKQTEGDPLVKSWLRRRQRQIAMNIIRKEVPRATVVITNPMHVAVALRYHPKEMPAPKVVAKGAGDIAASIRRMAEEHGVPVVRRPEVARALYRQVEVGHEIPVELYQAVAEIIAYVYRKYGRQRELFRATGR